MISFNYVNDIKDGTFISLLKIESDINNITDNIEIAYQEYVNALNVYELNKTFLESNDIDEEKITALEASEDNFVSKLGQGIIDIFKKTIAFITEMIDKLKEKFTNKKADFSKANLLCKQNPQLNKYLTDEVKSAIDSGKLKVTDIKALADLDKSYDELVAMSKRRNIDPNSLKAKWENAKKKFENFPKAPIVVGAVTIVGLMETYTRLNRNLTDSKSTLNNSLTEMVNFSTANRDSLDIGNKGYFRILTDAARYRAGQHVAAANESNSIAVFISNLADAVVRRASGYNANDRHDPNNRNTAYTRMKREVIDTVHQNNDRNRYNARQRQNR